jgi:hypothetical protein
MQYIDSIQPPLAVYGELQVYAGGTYYCYGSCEPTKDNVRFKPTVRTVQLYNARKHKETYDDTKTKTIAAQKAAHRKHFDIKPRRTKAPKVNARVIKRITDTSFVREKTFWSPKAQLETNSKEIEVRQG